jgi:hypothetical protein
MKNYLIKTKVIKINDVEIYIPEKLDNDMFEVVLIAENEKILTPTVCLVKETSEENYDYNWEEELEFKGVCYSKTYYPINFNPFTGHKFVFNKSKTKDITNEYNDIMNSFEEAYKMRKSKKKEQVILEIESRLEKLLEGIPLIFEKKESLSDDDSYNIFEFLQNTNEYGYTIF